MTAPGGGGYTVRRQTKRFRIGTHAENAATTMIIIIIIKRPRDVIILYNRYAGRKLQTTRVDIIVIIICTIASYGHDNRLARGRLHSRSERLEILGGRQIFTLAVLSSLLLLLLYLSPARSSHRPPAPDVRFTRRGDDVLPHARAGTDRWYPPDN